MKDTKGIWLFSLLAIGFVIMGTGVSAFMNQRETIDNALDSDDYNSWKQAHIDGLTEEAFNAMQERHSNRNKFQEQRQANFEEVQEALAAGDYQAWIQARQTMPGYNENMDLTENDFNTLVQIHELRETLPENFRMGPGRHHGGMQLEQGKMFN